MALGQHIPQGDGRAAREPQGGGLVAREGAEAGSARRLAPPLPAWPVHALLWGFPAWWLLGMTPFMVVVMGAVMAGLLLARGRLRLVPGVAPWFAFVAWVIPCGLMLESVLRLAGYTQRAANYAAIAVVLLYVVNAWERLPARRVVAGLTAVWLFVIVGGYLGLLVPQGRLVTPAGLFLPEQLTSNSYVRDLVFPPLAEIQRPWGAEEPYIRPSAPFPYANGWASAMAILTPVAFAQITLCRSARMKIILSAAALAAAVPAVASLNRGLFLGLALSISYVAVRLACRGAVLPFAGILAAGTAAVATFAGIGLFAELQQRAQYGSTAGRALLYRETFGRTLESPLVGHGAPLPSRLLDISVGTQGHLWMLMFSYGFVGLGLFLWFLYGAVLRTWRAPGRWQLWLHSSLVAECVMIAFYGLDTMQLLAVALLAAVLLAEQPPRGAVIPRRGFAVLGGRR